MSKKQHLASGISICLIVVVVTIACILMAGANPIEAFLIFFQGIFGSINGFSDIFVKSTPLILIGVGSAVAFKTGFFNIGGEGQFYMGAVVTAYVSLEMTSLPGVVRIMVAILASIIVGGVWALIAAFLKSKFNISEVIVTIMLNYIGINFLGLAVRTFLMDPKGNVPQSARIASDVSLPLLMPPSRVNWGIIIAIIAVIIVWILMEKTTLGYEMKVVGFNRYAAKFNGIPVVKSLVISAFLSGGLAGLAGAIEVLGTQRKLLEGISADCGYTAILIALVAGNKPIGILITAILWTTVLVGANSMQRQVGVPASIVQIIMGVLVLLILAKGIFKYTSKKKLSTEEN